MNTYCRGYHPEGETFRCPRAVFCSGWRKYLKEVLVPTAGIAKSLCSTSAFEAFKDYYAPAEMAGHKD